MITLNSGEGACFVTATNATTHENCKKYPIITIERWYGWLMEPLNLGGKEVQWLVTTSS